MKKVVLLLVLLQLCIYQGFAQTMDEMWDSSVSGKENPNLKWFKDAKFGMFIHWGLYSKLAGEYKGKRYYGSGEWIMNQGKIPVAEYAKVASTFNPTGFNADEWSQLAVDAGIKYMVITAKHHEGFAMYDSKVSNFNIVAASPYKKDPMKALAEANRKRGVQFGFYYSQFQDWYEPNGGRNTWDFDESKKDYQVYYKEKAIPQLKELLTNYGPLGIVWFDTPGGMTKVQTQAFIDELRVLQPKTLFSSRVGQGLGDYRDFGDSEVPSTPIRGAWESIYTHNDSWGFIKHDMNFKSSTEIIQLLANVASKGGNLMLNVGPDGEGRIPEYSIKFLQQTGKWLKINGESIYGTTYGLIPTQPWGVSTSKPRKQYLHVTVRPKNGELLIPNFNAAVKKVYALAGKKVLTFKKVGPNLIINLPNVTQDEANTVVVLEYEGTIAGYNLQTPVTVSSQFDENNVEAVFAKINGNVKTTSLTYSHYFGDWKHVTCVTNMKDSTDKAIFKVNVTEPGIYHVSAKYYCVKESEQLEGSLSVNNQEFLFRTLKTAELLDKKMPLMFIKHTIATITFTKPGVYDVIIRPLQNGAELFKLKSVIFEPLK